MNSRYNIAARTQQPRDAAATAAPSAGRKILGLALPDRRPSGELSTIQLKRIVAAAIG